MKTIKEREMNHGMKFFFIASKIKIILNIKVSPTLSHTVKTATKILQHRKRKLVLAKSPLICFLDMHTLHLHSIWKRPFDILEAR